MQRFILEQNIVRYRGRLAESSSEEARGQLRRMLASAERELALLNASLVGVRPRPTVARPTVDRQAEREALIQRFRNQFASSAKMAQLLDPEPGLTIIEANRTYEEVSGYSRKRLIGQPLFLMFPDNPDDPVADGVRNLYASLRRVADTGEAHTMALQRYDVRDSEGVFQERYWKPHNSPVLDEHGRLIFLLHLVEEVTDAVMARKGSA